ncbi:3-oxoacyl-[acyl-carrier protein] reductase [Rhizobium sp. SG_E_25_P2]|uniref:3-oxoacyl-ACP reductase n=1 Tax=Rhizobium sp. SG_E_25_P2 TaxID=2879942 RepID=UPI002473CD75|nr:3-oxoacyl-ACP reductase [Rhizobium sp. SG_E_25_P2]MDH6265301.1 3-oxoacyl-[acyl-carrier protein] reductase [Rhizobium sp. SG_E_25_P2]
MSKPIAEQTVIVTGAGRGLGAAIVRAFAREGANVVINYRNSREKAEALAETLGPKARAIRADVRNASEVEALIAAAKDAFGGVDTLVHNALADFSFNGDARDKLDRLSWEAVNAHLETGLKGALNLIRAAQPGMATQAFGRFVFIGTNLFQNPVVPYHDYTAAKAALLSLTRTAAKELGSDGITVNMVSGGLLRTTDASCATPEVVFDLIAANTPLQRVTTPEEAADAVLFFASPWARAVTGQNLIVDGGLVFG